MEKQSLRALMVNSSPRREQSTSRRFAYELIQALQDKQGEIKVLERDVSLGLPFVDAQWVQANFTAADQRSADDLAALQFSDTLVDELSQSDLLVLAVPLHNFSVPATLKAWIDQIARVGLTFNYTENGPVGKLSDKKAYVVVVTGGTAVGSEIDFATDYLKHILGFIGINDVTVISASAFNQDDAQHVNTVQEQILNCVEGVAHSLN